MSDEGHSVFVVDDDGDLAASLARMFRRNGWRSEPFVDPDAFVRAYAPAGPVCVVTDVHMGTTDGFALSDRARAVDPAAAFVFMTAWPDTRGAVAAVRLTGGIDYLDKPLDEARLLHAVANGLAWSAGRRAAEARLAPLSPREREVFFLLAEGLTNKAIAARLGLSEKTVEDHRAKVVAKTGMRGLADIIAAARALG